MGKKYDRDYQLLIKEKNELIEDNNKLIKEKNELEMKYIVLEKINLNIHFQYVFSRIISYDILPPVTMLANALISYISSIVNIKSESEKKDLDSRVNYTLDILHYFYMFANPFYFYDQPDKNESQIQQILIHQEDIDILNLVLNKYSTSKPNTVAGINNYIANELNKPLPSISIMEWINHLKPEVREGYQKYFKELYKQVKNSYSKLGYNIDESFLSRRIVHTSHSREILNEVFDIISKHTFEGSEKLIDDSKETRAKFLSMFSTTINTNEGLIEWKDVNRKNGSISFQSFKLIFEVMYEYDENFSYEYEKSLIISFFGHRKNGNLVKLSSEQIRKRGGNISTSNKLSKSNKLLEQNLRDLFNKYYANKS